MERCGGRRRTQMRRKAIDRLTSSGSRSVWRATICSCVMSPRQEMPPRFVVSKPLHTMTNDEQSEITLPKARSARCRREGGRGEVWGAGEVRARFGRDTGEMQARRDCGRACKRDPNEIQARFTGRVAPAARRGRGEHRVSQPKQPERRGFEWPGPARPLAHGKDLRAKRKRAGVSLAPSEPHAPRHRGNSPAASSGRRLRLPGGARRSRPCGWGRPRPRAPPRAAPTRRPSSAIRTTAMGRAESVMSVARWWGQ